MSQKNPTMPPIPRSQTRLEHHPGNHYSCFTCEFHFSLSSCHLCHLQLFLQWELVIHHMWNNFCTGINKTRVWAFPLTSCSSVVVIFQIPFERNFLGLLCNCAHTLLERESKCKAWREEKVLPSLFPTRKGHFDSSLFYILHWPHNG